MAGVKILSQGSGFVNKGAEVGVTKPETGEGVVVRIGTVTTWFDLSCSAIWVGQAT